MQNMKGIYNLLILVGACSAMPQQQSSQCPSNQDCVPTTQCINGIIDTGGAAFLIPKFDSNSKDCTDPYNPDASAICCKIPGVPDLPPFECPGSTVCVSKEQCGANGNVVTDGSGILIPKGSFSDCTVRQTSDVGVCCNPPIDYPSPTKCGVRSDTIDSNEAQFGEFPWQAIILCNDKFLCGASLISKDTLVTAAHCVYGVNHRDLKVRIGEWNRNNTDEPIPHIEVDVSSFNIHENFTNSNHHNNIAVVKLVKSLEYQYHINRICVPRKGQTFLPDTCIATGWGKEAIDGQKRDIMKKIELPIVENNKCQILIRNATSIRNPTSSVYFQLHDSFICAGGEENKDTCVGDGGGPLACQDPMSGQYFLVGITSWGVACGKKDAPGVYTDVMDFIPFIRSALTN